MKLLQTRRLRGEEGLTLIEILASMAILSISLLTILMMYRFNTLSGIDSQRRTIAANLARQEIESWREAAIDSDNIPNLPEETRSFDGVDYEVDVDIKRIGQNKYEIKSTVTWKNIWTTDPNDVKTIQFTLQRN